MISNNVCRGCALRIAVVIIMLALLLAGGAGAVINSPPNTPDIPSGPTTGVTNISYIYSTSATDPDGDPVSIFLDFGDGTIISGNPVESHTWLLPGTYNVKARAWDFNHNLYSNWSSPLVVTITQIIDDMTPPNTTVTLCGTLGNNGWYTSDVQVTLTATDSEGGSGINKTEYSLDNTNWSNYTTPFNINNERTTTVYYRSIDNAGNVEVTKNQTIKIDETPPQITINIPANGSAYILNKIVLANWSASDSISGIVSVIATTPNGSAIDTATIENKTFSVSATDNAGNQANKTITYSVVYNNSGVLPPINASGNSIFKLGSSIPVKFQLWDANGNYIATATARIYLAKVTNGVVGNEIEGVSSGNANTGNLFRIICGSVINFADTSMK